MQASKPIRRSILLGLALLYQGAGHAELPSGGTVVGGAATVSQDAQRQVINQGTSRAVIDWQNFSIGAGNSVLINQPNASSIMLNRVVGGNPSTILGSLSANGQVFLVNPFGVYFGAGASVDVGGLIATTMNIRNDDFMAGNYIFSRDASSAARREVINAGVLKAREGGYVVLAGDYAANSGVIQARLGTAALASGSKMTLDIKGDSLINFTVNEKTVAELSGVENSGQIMADGGRAIMTAAVARGLATGSVNNSGLVQAETAVEREGAIYLSADGGNTLVSGKLDASGNATGQKGGVVNVLGDKVALIDSAVIDASGDAGGGSVNIGGSYQGNGPLPNAQTAYVGKDVQIKVDALRNGNGGNAVVWSDEQTRYYGDISARGGAEGGDGGSIEVSGKARLDFNGTATTLAPKGKAGNLLLDPADITISTAANSDITGATPFADATGNGGASVLNVGTLETALGAGNVTVTTATASGTAAGGGTITVANNVGWSSASTLELRATNKILLNANLSGGNGTVWLNAGNGAIQIPGATITANSLLLSGSGFFDLVGVTPSNFVGSWNEVNTLATNLTNSTLRYSSNRNLTVGTVNGVSGVTNTNGDTQFYFDKNNASLTLAQGVASNSMYFRGPGGVNQTGGTVQLNDLALLQGSVNLSMSGNNIGRISADINGDLIVNTAGAMAVGNTYGQAGIKTNNHNVTISTGNAAGFDNTKLPDGTNPASLTLNESINAGAGTIKLTAGSGGVYQRHDLDADNKPLQAGSLTAGNLLLLGNSASNVTPFVLNNANNLVGTLAANANGSISYTGGPLAVGSVGGVSGITTTSSTVIIPAGADAAGRATPAIYNDNNISLSIGGDLRINENINAATANGSGGVTIGVGGDFTASTAAGKRIDANTLGVFGDDLKGTFKLVTKVSSLAAAGGKVMVIDNSAQTGELVGIGLGAPAADAGASTTAGLPADKTSRPIGDFYLTTGGALKIIKLLSKGNNLMLRSQSLDILLDAGTADGARIMLQPYNLGSRIGINNSYDPGFTADTNYSADTLLKFTNPTATFFVGTPQNVILSDSNVQDAAKNTLTGDVHIGSDGAFNLGYRSLSAQTTGNMLAYNVGPIYNLRLAAENLTINSFNTFGNQMHFFTNNLSLPGAASNYVNPNKPEITWRSLNDETMWVGSGLSNKPWEKTISADVIRKLPDGSTIIISGSQDYPFPNGGPGHGDIWMNWFGGGIGNSKLILSTRAGVKGSTSIVSYAARGDGTSGGLWQGCQNLTTCQGTNPSPFPDPTAGGGGTTGNNSGSGNSGNPSNTPTGECPGCPPAKPNTNPFPPDTTSGNGNTGTGGDGSGTGGSGTGSGGTGGGDGGAGTGSGGTGTGDAGTGTGSGTGGTADGSGDGGAGTGTGTGSGGSGDGGAGTGTGGAGDGGAGTGTGGAGGGDGGAGAGSGGTGDGGAGTGTGSAGDGSAGSGTGGAGTGGGDGGGGTGSGGAGDGGAGTGTGGAGDGSAGTGAGGTGNGSGDGGAGTGSGGAGNGGAGTGTGSAGDGSAGSGTGGSGAGGGDGGAGTGSGGAGNGGDGSGTGGTGDHGAGDGSGDGAAGTGSGGTGDGGTGAGTGTGIGTGNGADAGAGTGSGGAGDGGGDSGAGTAGGGSGDGRAGAGSGTAGEGGAGTGRGGDADGGGDSGAGSASGGIASGDLLSSGAGERGDQSNASVPQGFEISCNDVSAQPKEQDNDDSARSGGNRLVEIKRDGVKLRDPCQQQPEQGSKK
ncbi:MAG: hypothetical protein JWQ21_3462 [Herminiimonas sp.]|nr:hypothetical protein [Herminiimonas sp.]